MESTRYGSISGDTIFAGTNVGGGSLNVTINKGKAPPVFRLIPFSRNQGFINRNASSKLESILPSASCDQSAALFGLGGSGKSQIALDYAWRRARDPTCSVFWVHADSETTFIQDYKRISTILGLNERLRGTTLLTKVRERIEALENWALILDNADNLSLFGVHSSGQGPQQAGLYEFIPRGGTILWTSRDERIERLVSSKCDVQVDQMTPQEAISLLRDILPQDMPVDDEDDAKSLLAEIGWMPLAISQAAAYMRRTRMPVHRYLFKLRSGKELMAPQPSEFDRHRRPQVPSSILDTLGISIEYIFRENKAAYRILCHLAFLDNRYIPFELVRTAAAFNIQGTGSAHDDDEDLVREAATRLRDFSFLRSRVTRGGEAFEMHLMVQEAARYHLNRKQHETYFAWASIHVVDSLFPRRTPQNAKDIWDQCEMYLLHIQQAGKWATLCYGGKPAANLLERASQYLSDRGRVREKEPVDTNALELRRKCLGMQHPDTLRSMQTLARTYHDLGFYERAKEMYEEALEGQHRILGRQHPDTLTTTALLAITYRRQGKLAEAEVMQAQTLEIRRAVLGDRHVETIRSMSSLSRIYSDQNREREARDLESKVLTLRRSVLGERHPDTLITMSDIAVAYSKQGRVKEAAKMSGEVLQARREVLGEKHPDTLESVFNHSVDLYAMGQTSQAEDMLQEAIELQLQVLGPNHPYTKKSEKLLRAWKETGSR